MSTYVKLTKSKKEELVDLIMIKNKNIYLINRSNKAVQIGGYILIGFLALMLQGLGAATDTSGGCMPLYNEGKYMEAIQCYDKVIGENSTPNVVGFAWFQKSVCLYSGLGDLDGAFKAVDEAARIDPQYTGYRDIYIPNEKTRAFARANMPDDNAIKPYPNNTTALMYDGMDLYARGMYDESLQRYTDAIAIDPKNTTARFGKALVLIAKGELANVTKLFDEIVELGFKDAYVWEDLAQSLAETHGLYEEAIRCLDRAIAIYDESIRQDSRNTVAWNNKGVDLSLQAKVDRTAYLYLTLNTDDASISKSSAHADYRKDMWEKALECFDKAIQLDPKCATAWYNKGIILHELNDGYEKIENYEAIVKCFDQAKSLLDSEKGCSRLEDTRDAEYQAFIKLQELRMTSRDVSRVAKYA